VTDLVRPADPAEIDTWLTGWRTRWEADHARMNTDPATDRRVRRHLDSPDATVLRLLDNGEPAGYLALSTLTDYGVTLAMLDDVFVEEPFRRRGIGRAAVRYAEEWARPRAGHLDARLGDADVVQRALLRGWTLGGQGMVKTLPDNTAALPAGMGVRPMTEAEYPRWRERVVADYAQSFVDAGLLTLDEAAGRAEEQTVSTLPEGLATEGHEFLVLLADGEPAGEIWLRHAFEPGMSYVFMVAVHAGRRGRGLGRALMTAGESASRAAGSQRLGLYVFGHNTVAIRLYDSLGYRVIDQNWTLSLS
jgi:ribosomal protein S18 acetylase RimI-like enzyme